MISNALSQLYSGKHCPLYDIDNIHQHIVEEVASEEQYPKRWVRNVDPSTNGIEPALATTRLGNT